MSKNTKETSGQLGFYFDQNRCMSCNACTVACKDWNQVGPGKVHWREQFTYERDNKFLPLSMGCNHCADPKCEPACPNGAISKHPTTGIVSINRDACIEDKSCIAECPFSKPMLADSTQEPDREANWQVLHPAQKCTMCVDRIEDGLEPACVAACVGRALEYGTMAKLREDHPNAVQVSPNDADFADVYKNGKVETKPSMLVLKKKKQIEKVSPSTEYKPFA